MTPTGGGGSGSNGGSTGGDRPSRSPSATSEPSPRHTRSPDPSPTPTSSDPGSALAEVSAVPVGGALVLPQYRVVLTQPTAGVVHGFGAMCTHQGCLVGDGGGLLQCPCHGSQFSLSDGSVIQGPAPRSLPAQKVRVVDGWVYPA